MQIICCYIISRLAPVVFMPRHQKVAGYYVIPSEILSVRPSVCLSVRPSVSAHHHSCIGKSSYSFRPILLKLYRCFKDGLKICILFFQNPEIIFYHFFPIFNLDIFRALILQICIWSYPCIGNSSYSFWRILLKLYRCFKDGLKICILFFQNPEIIFYHFFPIFNLDIFRALILQICIWSYPCIGNSSYSFWRILLKLYRCFKDGLKICILFFQNPEIIFYHFFPIFNLDIFRALILQICIWSYPCIGNSSYSFWRILLKLYRCFKDGLKICILFFQNPEIIFYHFFPIFNLDIFRALILQICIWRMYLVSATPPTVFGESF